MTGEPSTEGPGPPRDRSVPCSRVTEFPSASSWSLGWGPTWIGQVWCLGCLARSSAVSTWDLRTSPGAGLEPRAECSSGSVVRAGPGESQPTILGTTPLSRWSEGSLPSGRAGHMPAWSVGGRESWCPGEMFVSGDPRPRPVSSTPHEAQVTSPFHGKETQNRQMTKATQGMDWGQQPWTRARWV